MRLVFAGTPDAAVPSLQALHDAGHDIALVLTRPDAPIGRRRVLTPSPVAVAALERGLPVHRTARLDHEALEAIEALSPDLGVIVAYGGLVRDPLLTTPAHGWVNLHFSLLPRWRGAAPVQHAVLAGDAEIGAGVFRLTPGLDEGDVFGQIRMPLPADATAGELLTTLAQDGADLLVEVVGAIADGSARAVAQSGEPTYAPKLHDADGRVDWAVPGDAVRARILGVTPEPGAFTSVDGVRLKLLGVQSAPHDAPRLDPGVAGWHAKQVVVGTGSAPIALTRVQPAGKAAMSAGDWWRGQRVDQIVFDPPASADPLRESSLPRSEET